MLSFDRPVVTLAESGTNERWAFAGGLHDSAATIVHDGNQHGLAIQLTPMGARVLFGLPGGALAGAVVDLEDLLGSHARELYDRTAAAPTWDTRFDILDDVLARAARRRLEDPPEPPSEVVRAWRRLVATAGAVGIGELAADVGWSRRHLSEKFRVEVGLSPKVAARVLRFERARHLLSMPTRPGLAAVATACGYYDQAHFTREWGELAGCTPTKWIADELPSMQDGE
jgi:AraC-like DNA-binding protein